MSNEPREAKDLDKLKEQAGMNKNNLNINKCKIIHLKKQMQKCGSERN